MNINTGEIAYWDQIPKELFDQFVPIPENLEDEAIGMLEAGQPATVDLRGNTPLAKWAAKRRKQRMKQAKKSRRANRK